MSQLDPWAQPRMHPPQMWNANKCCPVQGLGTSGGVMLGRGGQGRTTGSPSPRASKLTVSHALHLVLILCCSVGHIITPRL